MKPTEKQKKTPPAPVRPKSKSSDKPGIGMPSKFSAIALNLVAGVASVIFLTAFFQHNDPDPAHPAETHMNAGYDWLLNTMLKGNMELIEKNPNKTLQEKYELKWGPGEIEYVDLIKRTVPDTAVVMLPPHQLFKEVGFVETQTGPVIQRADQPGCKAFSMVDIPWISYFLYPRKVVYGDSVNSPLYSRASYIVSIGGWGLDKLKYPVAKPEAFMVLPINK